MFKYPASYMIYSEAFDGMPDWARERVYRGILDVLTGANKSERFARISEADRKAVLEILRDTKKDFAVYR